MLTRHDPPPFLFFCLLLFSVKTQVVAAFSKMKKLTTSWRLIAKAIECSAVVELNTSRSALRRRQPLPDPRANPTWVRTVLAENLPRNPSIEQLRSMFGVAGTVSRALR
jgi:La-related protein 7